jgi:hypothetical protein
VWLSFLKTIKYFFFIFFFVELRLLWSTGANNPAGVFIVGIYVDKQFLSKGSGEKCDIAEEMAARDALCRIYGTGEDKGPLPFGDKARQFSDIINQIYNTLKKDENEQQQQQQQQQ